MWTGISASLNLPQSRLPNPALQVYCNQASVDDALVELLYRPSLPNPALQVYCNQASVDDALVELLYRPSCDPGAIGVFVSVLTGQC